MPIELGLGVNLIPLRYQHLIQRPLKHYIGPRFSGWLLMEFNGQVFRHDIRITREEFSAARDSYEHALRTGVEKIRQMAEPVIARLDEERKRKLITVQKLRDILAGMPNDAEVRICVENDTDDEYDSIEVSSVLYDTDDHTVELRERW
jgi:hypothetical protein